MRPLVRDYETYTAAVSLKCSKFIGTAKKGDAPERAPSTVE